MAVLLESFFTDLGASKDAMHREESQVHRLDPLMELCARGNAREREGDVREGERERGRGKDRGRGLRGGMHVVSVCVSRIGTHIHEPTHRESERGMQLSTRIKRTHSNNKQHSQCICVYDSVCICVCVYMYA